MAQQLVRHMRAHFVAYFALFFALGGTSIAAVQALPRNSVGSPQIKNRSIQTIDVSRRAARALRGRRGPRGFTGAKGATGAKGDKGDKGATGASGATGSALLTGQVSGLPATGTGSATFRRAAVNGVSVVGLPSEVASLVPGRNLVARNLTARILQDIPVGGSVRIDLVQNPAGNFSDGSSPTPLSCTIVGTAGTDTSCTAPGPMALSPESIIFMRISIVGGTSSTTDPSRAYWGITVEPA
jgi:hypothetical protein